MYILAYSFKENIPDMAYIKISGCYEEKFNGYYGKDIITYEVGPQGTFYKLDNNGNPQTDKEQLFASAYKWYIGDGSTSDTSSLERYCTNTSSNEGYAVNMHPWDRTYVWGPLSVDHVGDPSTIKVELIKDLVSDYTKPPEIGDIFIVTLPQLNVDNVEFTCNTITTLTVSNLACTYIDKDNNVISIVAGYGSFNMKYNNISLVENNDLMSNYWAAQGGDYKEQCWSSAIAYGATSNATGFIGKTKIKA